MFGIPEVGKLRWAQVRMALIFFPPSSITRAGLEALVTKNSVRRVFDLACRGKIYANFYRGTQRF